MAMRALIAGVGHYLPPRQVTNAELPPPFNADPTGIARRTGIESRHWVDGKVYTSDLAAEAARRALADAGIDPGEIDGVIAATLSPDYAVPGIGVYIQAKLGLADIPAYDIRNQCSGFLYSVNVARGFVQAEIYQRVLVVCAELHSHAAGKAEKDAHITPLFGDGAGAVVITGDAPARGRCLGIDYLKVYADGRGADRLRQRVWDISIDPFMDWAQVCESPEVMWHAEMDGPYIFRRAVAGMASAAKECLAAMNLTLDEIAYVLPHQANLRICETLASVLQLPRGKLLTNIQRVGNTTAASIPILLSETVAAGTIRTGDRVLLLAFGSGLTWGAALLTAC